MKYSLFTMMGIVPAIILIAGAEGQDKAPTWKLKLPAGAYKELTQRSIKTIEETAKSGAADGGQKIAVEAAILHAYTFSAENANADDVATLRGAALAARKMDIKQLATFGAFIKTAPKPLTTSKEMTPSLDDVGALMEIFRNKSKGGEGIHDDLKYQPKLEKLNGIEALLGALSSKKLSDANLAKVSKELPLLAYRIAVVGAITDQVPPKKDAAKWREYAGTMRDMSIAMAEASQKKDGNGIMKAADALQNSCTQCHSDFKGK